MDKRNFPRLSVDANAHVESSSGRRQAQIFDLSCGGIGLSSKENFLSVSSKCKIQLQTKNISTTDIQGEVLRVDFSEENKSYLYGIRFISEDLALKLNIIKFLNENLYLTIAQEVKNNPELKDEKIMNFFHVDAVQFIKNMLDGYTRYRLKELSKDEFQNLVQFLSEEISAKGTRLDQYVENKLTRKNIRGLFRKIIGNLMYQSISAKRALDKPRGYPGDYLVLEMVYNNVSFTDDLKYFLDVYFLDMLPYTIAVRNRKDTMRQILEDCICNSKKNLSILNLACGSCREIRELIPNIKELKNNIAFTLVDHDEEALNFSKEALTGNLNTIRFDFKKENVLELMRNPNTMEKQDIVYSIGLADYLPDKILIKFIKFSTSLLNAKGKFIIAFKNRAKHEPMSLDWFCDWHFIPRNREDGLRVVENSVNFADYSLEIMQEKSGIVFFLILTKKTINI